MQQPTFPASDRKIDSLEGCARLALSDHWTPQQILRPKAGPLVILWADMSSIPVNTTFNPFDSNIMNAYREIPWFLTSSDRLPGYALAFPGVPLKGIFCHMSRCGSTLASNLLGAIENAFSIPEPALVNGLADPLLKDARDPEARALLRAGLATFIRPRGGGDQLGYLKCTSWNILVEESIYHCSNEAPMVFLHRDPCAVLVSLERGRPGWCEEGSFLLELLGIDEGLTFLERTARILAAYLKTALEAESHGRCRLMGYPDLLERCIDGDLPDYFGYEVDNATRQRMLEVATFNSKKPGAKFTSDVVEKRAAASPELKKVARDHLEDIYAEVLRRS